MTPVKQFNQPSGQLIRLSTLRPDGYLVKPTGGTFSTVKNLKLAIFESQGLGFGLSVGFPVSVAGDPYSV